MLYNFTKIDNSGKLSLFRKGTSNSIGLTDVKLPAANMQASGGLGDMKMDQVTLATQQGFAGNVMGAVPIRFTGRLTLNKETIANLNNNGSNGGLAVAWNTWGQNNPECDTPTINDACFTIRKGCTGLTNEKKCGWTTFGDKCGCSHSLLWLCGAAAFDNGNNNIIIM